MWGRIKASSAYTATNVYCQDRWVDENYFVLEIKNIYNSNGFSVLFWRRNAENKKFLALSKDFDSYEKAKEHAIIFMKTGKWVD